MCWKSVKSSFVSMTSDESVHTQKVKKRQQQQEKKAATTKTTTATEKGDNNKTTAAIKTIRNSNKNSKKWKKPNKQQTTKNNCRSNNIKSSVNKHKGSLDSFEPFWSPHHSKGPTVYPQRKRLRWCVRLVQCGPAAPSRRGFHWLWTAHTRAGPTHEHY